MENLLSLKHAASFLKKGYFMTSQIYNAPKGHFAVNPKTGTSSCHHAHCSLSQFRRQSHRMDLQDLQLLLLAIDGCPFYFQTRPSVVRKITTVSMDQQVQEALIADNQLIDKVKAVVDQRLALSGNSCCTIL
jgi:hypothetical protein